MRLAIQPRTVRRLADRDRNPILEFDEAAETGVDIGCACRGGAPKPTGSDRQQAGNTE
jgi:hypothetical protein